MVKFKASKKDRELINGIVARAAGELQIVNKLSLMMDLEAVHSNGTRMDFAKLLGFDTFNFVHDICGIMRHIDRKTGKLTDCFLPMAVR